MYLHDFKKYNSRAEALDSFHYENVKNALHVNYCWDFLPSAAIDIIKRYSMPTIDILDMLYMYKYVNPKELVDMATYATGLHFRFLERETDLGKKIKSDFDILIFQMKNGVDYVVYMGIHKLYSEAQIAVSVPGNILNIFYLLPSNFEEIKDISYIETYKWDYYILFGRYMFYCIEHNASDLHIGVIHQNKEPKYFVMCRIGPDREECNLFTLNEQSHRALIKDTIKERSSNQQAILDLDAGLGVVVTLADIFNDGNLEVRCTVEKVLGGYYCVCRLQEVKTTALSLDELGFDPLIVKSIRDTIQRPSGLTIITGKIRTGKNTTMASIGLDIVRMANKPSIMSFDDPIEILGEYPQTDYKGEISLLKAGIRLAKKLDLDYVLLNEIPNAEVAFGVRDLVNSSIHTLTTWHMNRVWHLPHKLFEYFGESYRDLISQINIVCNQRLYKRQCPYCQETIHRANHESDKRIHDFFVRYNLTSSLVSRGCEHCNYTGYLKGSVVVLPEILVFSQDLVLKLFKADRPYDMELVLINEMKDSPFSLEYQMKNALSDGRLSPIDVLSIL